MIRKATQKDFNFIHGLHIHPEVSRFLFYEPMPAEEFRPLFNKLLEQGILYVYEEEIVVMGMFKFMPQQHRAAHIADLGGIAVHPSFAGKGCGQRMLHEIMQLGKHMGFLRIQLGVSEVNAKAIHLYEKAGFKKEGRLKKYIHLKNENIFLDDVLMAYLFE
jgi:L-phenylalanine/L-methionine N-acetyltransferase